MRNKLAESIHSFSVTTLAIIRLAFLAACRAINLKPDYAEAYKTNRGHSYYYGSKANLDQAIADYSKAIERRPEYAYAYNNCGAAFMDNGFPDKAIALCSLSPAFHKLIAIAAMHTCAKAKSSCPSWIFPRQRPYCHSG